MPDSPHRPRVTVEDLLHLKRAERPSADFWLRFESSLREKQLSALLHRRPWWQSPFQMIAQRRAFLPLGATAAVICTLVSVKYFAPVQNVQPGHQTSSAAEVASIQPAPAQAAFAPATVPEATAARAAAPEAGETALGPLSASLPERASELTPWSAPAPVEPKSISASVARFETADQDIDQASVNGRFFAAALRPQSPEVTTAELTSVTAATSRRSRLLAQFDESYYAPSAQAPKAGHDHDRLARQLADADFNERFSRVGVKGDQVSLKF